MNYTNNEVPLLNLSFNGSQLNIAKPSSFAQAKQELSWLKDRDIAFFSFSVAINWSKLNGRFFQDEIQFESTQNMSVRERVLLLNKSTESSKSDFFFFLHQKMPQLSVPAVYWYFLHIFILRKTQQLLNLPHNRRFIKMLQLHLYLPQKITIYQIVHLYQIIHQYQVFP